MTATPDLDALTARLDRLEAESAIRVVLVRYMEMCDRLDASTDLIELGNLFAADATWVGTGARYAAEFGEMRGRSAIVAMIARYCTETPHFAMNAHFLTSESIEVDGEVACGGWVMLQTSTYADGKSDLRSARLLVYFARADGRWRISRFATENIFSRAIDRWDDPASVTVRAGASQ